MSQLLPAPLLKKSKIESPSDKLEPKSEDCPTEFLSQLPPELLRPLLYVELSLTNSYYRELWWGERSNEYNARRVISDLDSMIPPPLSLLSRITSLTITVMRHGREVDLSAVMGTACYPRLTRLALQSHPSAYFNVDFEHPGCILPNVSTVHITSTRNIKPWLFFSKTDCSNLLRLPSLSNLYVLHGDIDILSKIPPHVANTWIALPGLYQRGFDQYPFITSYLDARPRGSKKVSFRIDNISHLELLWKDWYPSAVIHEPIKLLAQVIAHPMTARTLIYDRNQDKIIDLLIHACALGLAYWDARQDYEFSVWLELAHKDSSLIDYILDVTFCTVEAFAAGTSRNLYALKFDPRGSRNADILD